MILPKAIRVNFPIKINESQKNHIKFIVSRNESLAECKIKNEICRLLYGHEYVYEHKKELRYLLN